MDLPAYFLRRPPLPEDPRTIERYEALWAEITRDPGRDLTHAVESPRWRFLAYLAEHKPVLFHGSGDASLATLVPRQANDVNDFGNRQAVYAASDGIWPIYFAIVDRGRMPISLLNGCFRPISPAGVPDDPAYFFSISQEALAAAPWRNGTVYILPREGFEPRPPLEKNGRMHEIMEWASLSAVTPLAKVSVGPADFPFLDAIRGHDPQVVGARAAADPTGFPWLEEQG
ncbi:MAG TPA: hypothetical protein VD886_22475 [Herpetosiphonaceae bacterium]|nr:hypothetical protein [Herpetosiphonaceae bacterium]